MTFPAGRDGLPAPAVLVGLIGSGIQASRTPAMHEEEGRNQGLRYLYRLIDLDVLGLGPDALPDLLDAAQRMGFTGLNITHPCKQKVIALLDELSGDAAAIGAVNTVVFRGTRRVGHNTDGWGFAESFRRGIPDVQRRCAVLLGAGGAGAAVAHAALSLGVERLLVFDTDAAKAEELVARLAAGFGEARVALGRDIRLGMEAADGLIHATPTGMASHPGVALPADLLRPRHWVAEVVYFPLETELLRLARRIGCRTLDGGGMAVFQAVEAFRLFTGVVPDPERMRRHFDAIGRARGESSSAASSSGGVPR